MISRRNFTLSMLSLFITLKFNLGCTNNHKSQLAKDKLSDFFQSKIPDRDFSIDILELFLNDLKKFKPQVFEKLDFQHQIFQEELLKTFIMSTNYFKTRAPEPLRYQTFYYPERFPCQNPFAILD